MVFYLKTISLGGICSNFTCAKCCKDTEMLLSREDIARIQALGFSKDEFCFLDSNGFYKLQNIDGSCFFLKNNQCKIYSNRPQGCKFYPMIFDVDNNKAVCDNECPLKDSLSEKLVDSFSSDLRKFINLLMEENEKLKEDRLDKEC